MGLGEAAEGACRAGALGLHRSMPPLNLEYLIQRMPLPPFPEGRYFALTHLTRLTQRREEGRALLARALSGRLAAAAPDVLRVAVEAGDPVGRLLAERWAVEGREDLAEPLAELCESESYRASLPLRELALVTAAGSGPL